jgi:serine/threonine-protein kinase
LTPVRHALILDGVKPMLDEGPRAPRPPTVRGFALQEPGRAPDSHLPRDLQEAAAARLAFVAAVGLATAAVASLASLFRVDAVGARAGMDRPLWMAPLFVVVSAIVLIVALRPRLAAGTKIAIGIGYLIVGCAMVALFRHSLRYLPEDVLRGFSPVTLAILFFACVVPMRPRRMALVATAATLTDPLALGVSIALGNSVPEARLWLWLFLPNLVVVGLAIVAAHVVYGLGRHVEEARQLGSYRLLHRLGAGGMGEVWRAEHATLARPAAVKIIRPEVLDAPGSDSGSKALLRFEREARATAMLTSPHTVELFDYGVGDDGTCFYVMELLEGMDLETVLGRAPVLPPERVVHLLLGVCHSLRDAHACGLVHRDVKPANLFICRKGGDVDFPKVLDFGLARRVETGAPGTRLTLAGEVLGTPQYMAPEVATGGEVDGRADLYALGCVAYRMLTGREVFEEPGVVALLLAHLQQVPAPLETVAPAVPADLARLVMRCLAKSPADRPASATVLWEALQATGLAARWTQERARAWWSEQPPGDATPGAPTAVAPGALARADTLEA